MLGEAHYDFITTEPSPLRNAGVSALYSVEFARLVRPPKPRDLRCPIWVVVWR